MVELCFGPSGCGGWRGRMLAGDDLTVGGTKLILFLDGQECIVWATGRPFLLIKVIRTVSWE